MTKGYAAATCVCSHTKADHTSNRARGLTVKFGRCRVPGCACEVFTLRPDGDEVVLRAA